jgi:hypothetical protein
MKTITLKRVYSDKEAEKKFHKKFLTEADYSLLITEDTDAYNSQGQLLFKFRKNVIPFDILKLGYESFKESIIKTEVRGAAAGEVKKRVFKGVKKKITITKLVLLLKGKLVIGLNRAMWGLWTQILLFLTVEKPLLQGNILMNSSKEFHS